MKNTTKRRPLNNKKFTLWEEIEWQLADTENQGDLIYIIKLLNYITGKLYKNHKNYWDIPIKERKYFLIELTTDILNGYYKSNDKKWNEQTFQVQVNPIQQKRKKPDKDIEEPKQPEFLTDTDVSSDDQTISEETSGKKVRFNTSQRNVSRENKSKQ